MLVVEDEEDIRELGSYLAVNIARNVATIAIEPSVDMPFDIADYSVNIAQDVIYMVNGTIVRHGTRE